MLEFLPKIVIVVRSGPYLTMTEANTMPTSPLVFLRTGYIGFGIRWSGVSVQKDIVTNINVSRFDNIITWYSDQTFQGTAQMQFNEAWVTYAYAAIG